MKIKCLETKVISKRERIKRVIEQKPRGNLIEQYGINCDTEKREEKKIQIYKKCNKNHINLCGRIVWWAQLKTDIWKK